MLILYVLESFITVKALSRWNDFIKKYRHHNNHQHLKCPEDHSLLPTYIYLELDISPS